MLGKLKDLLRRRSRVGDLFIHEEAGAILAEALLVIPVVTIFAAGVIEFGNVFWQRHQMENGVRDAARYWARCRSGYTCSATVAKNIALYGSHSSSSGQVRVPGWTDPSLVTLQPATPADFPLKTTNYSAVIVTGSLTYSASPLFALLQIPPITITVRHEQRYIGW